MTPLMYYLSKAISFIFFATKDASVLKAEINTLVPEGYTIDMINSDVDDFMLPAWDVNQRTPRFFSKWAVDTIKNEEN